ELPLDDSAVEHETFSMRCVCVMPADHHLASLSIITPEDLDDVPFISLDPGHDVASRLSTVFQSARVRLNVRASVQLFSPACVLVSEGMGVSVVDPLTARRHLDAGVVTRPFEPAIPF